MSTTRSRAIVLDVPVFGQEEAACGITSLKSALWHLGRRVSAARLARLAGGVSDGIDHGELVNLARDLGASVFSRDRGSIRELRWFLARGLTPIVGWWSRDPGDSHYDPSWSLPERRARDCGHYSVVCGIDATRILMMDPQWEERGGRLRILGLRWMPISRFRRVWYDTDTSAYRKVERWYMMVHFGRDRFGSRFEGGRDHRPTAGSDRLT